MADKTYSTLQAAKRAGIHRATLIRWLQDGNVKASTEVPLAGGNILRRWTDADIDKLKSYKAENYWAMPPTRNPKK
jgi:transposase